jgi:hypothetical protein
MKNSELVEIYQNIKQILVDDLDFVNKRLIKMNGNNKNNNDDDDDDNNNNNNNIVEELEYYINKDYDGDTTDETVDKILEMFERILNKEIEKVRQDLKYATPEEYWMLQGEINALKRFIDKLNY